MYWKSLKGSALLTLGFRGFSPYLMFISRRRDFYTNTYHSVKKNSLSFEHHSSKETWVENISYIFLEKIPIWPPMNPRWVRSETIFDDETLTTAEGNGMQWAGQWSGYYPPTLCKLCNYVLGKLFVRFFYAVDDRGITHQPLTKLCKQSFGEIICQISQGNA